MTGVTPRLALLVAAALAAAATGCAPALPGEVESPTSVERGFDRPTTSGELAASNLTSQILSYERALERVPGERSVRRALVGLLLTRAAFAGTFDDFERAAQLAEADVAAWPDDPSALALRAQVFSAVHEFDAALGDVAQAEGPTAVDLRATIALAVGGDLSEALLVRSAAAEAVPTFDNLAALAAVRAALGEFEAADALYRDALDAYGDVSPFPVAWVAFQRGVMWGERADRPDLARGLYQEAVARLPLYVVANVHLAELEAQAGDVAAAVDRLRPFVGATEDPEAMGKLASWLSDESPTEAADLVSMAESSYEALLARHPRAFLDHASEFFMGPGADPARALALALANLDSRRDDRAWQIAIQAALGARDTALACALSDAAGPGRVSVPLTQLQSQVCSLRSE